MTDISSSSKLCFSRNFIAALSVIFLLALASGIINSLYIGIPYFDSSVFLSSGWHMKSGYTLYKDIWDMKPPVIHFINYCSAILGSDQLTTVRLFEKIALIIATLSFLGTALLCFRSFFIALAGSLFFLHYFSQESLLEGGNLAEEYGCSFLLAGVFSLLFYLDRKPNRVWLYTSGLFMGLAVLTKETFVISVLPWLLYLLNSETNNRKLLLSRIVAVCNGLLIPFGIFLLYFISNDSLLYWLDNFFYSSSRNSLALGSFFERMPDNLNYFRKYIFAVSSVGMALFTVAIIGLLKTGESKKLNNIPLFLLLTFLADYLATMISDKGFGHYYLQAIPTFILIICFGLHLLKQYVLPSQRRLILSILLILLISGELTSWTGTLKKIYAGSSQLPQSDYARTIISETSSSDYIWAPSAPYLYVETQRLSPTRYHFYHQGLFFDSKLASSQDHFRLLKSDLFMKLPKFIAISDRDLASIFVESPDIHWFEQNYRQTGYPQLYQLK